MSNYIIYFSVVSHIGVFYIFETTKRKHFLIQNHSKYINYKDIHGFDLRRSVTFSVLTVKTASWGKAASIEFWSKIVEFRRRKLNVLTTTLQSMKGRLGLLWGVALRINPRDLIISLFWMDLFFRFSETTSVTKHSVYPQMQWTENNLPSNYCSKLFTFPDCKKNNQSVYLDFNTSVEQSSTMCNFDVPDDQNPNKIQNRWR